MHATHLSAVQTQTTTCSWNIARKGLDIARKGPAAKDRQPNSMVAKMLANTKLHLVNTVEHRKFWGNANEHKENFGEHMKIDNIQGSC